MTKSPTLRLRAALLAPAAALALAAAPARAQILNDDILKFGRVLNLIDMYYVDTVDKAGLTEAAITGMLRQLDPHSSYISKKEMERVNEEMSGAFEGIGVQFNIMDDTLMVVSPISGGPSERAGILAGDRILTVDGQAVAGVGIDNEKVFKLLRGKKGTKVELGIRRRGVAQVEIYTVTRDKIPLHSLDAAYMAAPATGYIKLNRFSATTMQEYQRAAAALYKQGMRNLVLDLTNNGGGYMNMAIDLADEFLGRDKLIVYTEGDKSPKESFRSTSRGGLTDGRLIVMIDEGSASASEIVSGALQDWDRAVIVGRRSFGKGLVQKQFGLPDGSATRITIARYHTPTGRVIQRPYEKDDQKYRQELTRRYENGELYTPDSISFPDSLKYSTLDKKRTVYGGGGIMPDIFVPIDTAGYTDFLRGAARKGLVNKFALQYLDANRGRLKSRYPDFEAYDARFEITDDIVSQFAAFAQAEGVEAKEGELERSRRSLALQLRALLARNLYDENAFYRIFKQLDPIYQAALDIIGDKKRYEEILR